MYLNVRSKSSTTTIVIDKIKPHLMLAHPNPMRKVPKQQTRAISKGRNSLLYMQIQYLPYEGDVPLCITVVPIFVKSSDYSQL